MNKSDRRQTKMIDMILMKAKDLESAKHLDLANCTSRFTMSQNVNN